MENENENEREPQPPRFWHQKCKGKGTEGEVQRKDETDALQEQITFNWREGAAVRL